jgi:NhaP-type Na+/H+ or K+/H+ antiporter
MIRKPELNRTERLLLAAAAVRGAVAGAAHAILTWTLDYLTH